MAGVFPGQFLEGRLHGFADEPWPPRGVGVRDATWQSQCGEAIPKDKSRAPVRRSRRSGAASCGAGRLNPGNSTVILLLLVLVLVLLTTRSHRHGSLTAYGVHRDDNAAKCASLAFLLCVSHPLSSITMMSPHCWACKLPAAASQHNWRYICLLELEGELPR